MENKFLPDCRGHSPPPLMAPCLQYARIIWFNTGVGGPFWNKSVWSAAFPPDADYNWPDVMSGMIPQHCMPFDDTVVALSAWTFSGRPHLQSYFLSAPSAIAHDVLSCYSQLKKEGSC
jgi:hypothetical protein